MQHDHRHQAYVARCHSEFWHALHTISQYLTPDQLLTRSERLYGLPPEEATEYAYENALETAKAAIKGARKPS